MESLPTPQRNTTAQTPPFRTRVYYGIILFALQYLLSGPVRALTRLRHYFYPPEIRPDLVRAYACRPRLPVRSAFTLVSAAASASPSGSPC